MTKPPREYTSEIEAAARALSEYDGYPPDMGVAGSNNSSWEEYVDLARVPVTAALAARPIEAGSVVEFLHEAARYFENCPSKDEDRAFWATVYAENCRKAADLIQSQAAAIAERDEQLRDYEVDQIAQGRRLRRLHARAERMKKVLRDIATLNKSRDQLQAIARAALQQEGESDE